MPNIWKRTGGEELEGPGAGKIAIRGGGEGEKWGEDLKGITVGKRVGRAGVGGATRRRGGGRKEDGVRPGGEDQGSITLQRELSIERKSHKYSRDRSRSSRGVRGTMDLRRGHNK